MKRFISLTLLTTLLIFSCQKEINQPKQDFLGTIQSSLKDSLQASLFNTLDFGHSVLSEVDSIDLFVLRIPFIGKKMENDFVVVKTDQKGAIQVGKVVHMEGGETEYGNGKVKSKRFNGNISISSLNQNYTVSSDIKDGYIQAYHQPNNLSRTQVLPGEDVLPEVVVVAYVPSSGGVSYSDWMAVQSYFYDPGGSGGGSTGTYSPTSGGGGGGSSSGSSGTSSPSTGTPKAVTGGGIQQAPVINIDIETGENLPAIDIQKYLNCFNSIPDAGSTCSIEILTDIPVDGDPSKFFNWQTGSPGHTFLKLEKQNGSQSVQQIFGWYPAVSWSVIPSPAPVNGKFVDNSNHEFNASYNVNIAPSQLQSAITHVLYLSRFIKYDIDEYNCTDFALEVFNYAMPPQNQLVIQKYDIPGGESPTGTNTPNGLFLKLQQMQKAGGTNAGNINLPGVKGWVGPSNGPCN